MPSIAPRPAARVHVRTEGPPDAPTALVLPGRGYDVEQPLLGEARALLRSRGWRVQSVSWDGPPPANELELHEACGALLTAVPAVVVAKSLTTRLLPLAVEFGLPGLWLTPLLHDPHVRAAVTAATAPTVLVGGEADVSWDGPFAGSSRHRVVEIAAADHSLVVANDPGATAAALALVRQELADLSNRIVSASGFSP